MYYCILGNADFCKLLSSEKSMFIENDVIAHTEDHNPSWYRDQAVAGNEP